MVNRLHNERVLGRERSKLTNRGVAVLAAGCIGIGGALGSGITFGVQKLSQQEQICLNGDVDTGDDATRAINQTTAENGYGSPLPGSHDVGTTLSRQYKEQTGEKYLQPGATFALYLDTGGAAVKRVAVNEVC